MEQILLTGFIGDAGARILFENRREALLSRFSASFLRPLENTAAMTGEALKTAFSKAYEAAGLAVPVWESAAGDAEAREQPTVFFLSEGGLYTALWRLSKAYRCGFRIPQAAIPVHQETIEVCNFFDINPYALYSEGCALLIVPEERTARILSSLRDEGIPAAWIGELTKEKKKVLLRKDEERFIARPEKDPLRERNIL